MAAPSGSSEAGSLAEERLDGLLELIAQRTPAPGGGSAAACAAAIAAALQQMAAAFTLTRDEYADRHEAAGELHTRAGALRAAAVELADRERHSYVALLDALRLPAGSPDRDQRIAAGRAEAIAAPLELCRLAAETAEIGAQLTRDGNPNLAGDAICGTLLAEAACQAAAALVRLNVAASDGQTSADAASADAASALADRAQEARRLALRSRLD